MVVPVDNVVASNHEGFTIRTGLNIGSDDILSLVSHWNVPSHIPSILRWNPMFFLGFKYLFRLAVSK
jgi:hypothetical protein